MIFVPFSPDGKTLATTGSTPRRSCGSLPVAVAGGAPWASKWGREKSRPRSLRGTAFPHVGGSAARLASPPARSHDRTIHDSARSGRLQTARRARPICTRPTSFRASRNTHSANPASVPAVTISARRSWDRPPGTAPETLAVSRVVRVLRPRRPTQLPQGRGGRPPSYRFRPATPPGCTRPPSSPRRQREPQAPRQRPQVRFRHRQHAPLRVGRSFAASSTARACPEIATLPLPRSTAEPRRLLFK